MSELFQDPEMTNRELQIMQDVVQALGNAKQCVHVGKRGSKEILLTYRTEQEARVAWASWNRLVSLTQALTDAEGNRSEGR